MTERKNVPQEQQMAPEAAPVKKKEKKVFVEESDVVRMMRECHEGYESNKKALLTALLGRLDKTLVPEKRRLLEERAIARGLSALEYLDYLYEHGFMLDRVDNINVLARQIEHQLKSDKVVNLCAILDKFDNDLEEKGLGEDYFQNLDASLKNSQSERERRDAEFEAWINEEND